MDSKVNLEEIFERRMDADEAAVFKLAIMYDRAFRKAFDGTGLVDGETFRLNTLPKEDDPRKSNIFQFCWKLRRETRGLLEKDQYMSYIEGSLHILKINQRSGIKKGFVTIRPSCICGDKAWLRWKLHERMVRDKNDEIASSVPRPSAGTDQKICMYLDKTKKFLFERCEGNVTSEKIEDFVEKGFFKLWVAAAKVSPYYVVLSPLVSKFCDIDKLAEDCSFDPKLILGKVTDGVRSYFKTEFKHESASSISSMDS